MPDDLFGYAVTIRESGLTSYRAIADSSFLVTGETFSITPPSPSMAEDAVEIMGKVQAWIDTTAHANGYDDINSCISYASSTIAQWAKDAAQKSAYTDYRKALRDVPQQAGFPTTINWPIEP